MGPNSTPRGNRLKVRDDHTAEVAGKQEPMEAEEAEELRALLGQFAAYHRADAGDRKP
jgi:hypothetical protein